MGRTGEYLFLYSDSDRHVDLTSKNNFASGCALAAKIYLVKDSSTLLLNAGN